MGFDHVYAILRLSNSWVKVSHNFAYTEVQVIPLGWIWADAVDGELQKFTVDIPYNQKRYGFGAMTCVETVKGLLGISNWRVVTPKQLRRYIDGQKT